MWRGKETVEISEDDPLEPGTKILMHFKTWGGTYITAAEIAMIEWKLEKEDRFRIRSHSLPADQTVIFEIEVLKHNPVLLTAGAIAAVIIVSGVIGFLLLTKVERIIDTVFESPVGKYATVGVTTVIIVLVLYFVYVGLAKK